MRSMAKIGVPVVAVALVLSACGSRSNGSSSSSSGGSKTATIGIIAPLTGSLSALGLGIQHSVELAVKQANAKKTIPGWTLKTDAEDDQAQPNVGQQAATKLASDPSVVGVVGTLNSSVAQTVIPVLDKANIVQVSPANTNPSLTQGANFASAPSRPNKNYFRVCTTDAIQGPFAAQYVYQTLGIKKAATINDQKTYGAGLVAAFEQEFKKEGGTITSHQTINADGHRLLRRHLEGQGHQPGPGLLRRRVPAGWPAVQAVQGSRPERARDGRRRHVRPRLHQAGRPEVER